MRRKRDSGASGRGGLSWRRALWAWLPVLLLECLVVYLSTRPGLRLPGRIPHLDKCAHFAEYAVLGGLLLRALRLTGVRTVRSLWLVILAVAVLAALDERLQASVPGRESSPYDWLADVSGGAIGAALGWWWGKRGPKRERTEGWIVPETEG